MLDTNSTKKYLSSTHHYYHKRVAYPKWANLRLERSDLLRGWWAVLFKLFLRLLRTPIHLQRDDPWKERRHARERLKAMRVLAHLQREDVAYGASRIIAPTLSLPRNANEHRSEIDRSSMRRNGTKNVSQECALRASYDTMQVLNSLLITKSARPE